MLNTLIVGASGYAGVELATFLNRHPHMNITALAVSAQSPDAGKRLSDLHPQLKGVVDLPLQPLSSAAEWADKVDVVFLATAHEVSHDLAPAFLDAGCVVFDLSGAFRVNDSEFYQRYYGFTHQHGDWLDKAVYGLAEWNHDKVKEAQLVAVPGCYPTAAQLALKPLVDGVTCRLKPGVSHDDVAAAFHRAYHDKPLVRVYEQGVPALKAVIGQPFCDIGFAVQGEHLIVVAAEDNLLKGAASQAVQCMNIRFGFPETQSLI
ncbi:MAG: NAGSA dehydrogenase family protein [Pantoea sp.]|nr:NAGSA dehydrogenase family protein [Pantoea sp.]